MYTCDTALYGVSSQRGNERGRGRRRERDFAHLMYGLIYFLSDMALYTKEIMHASRVKAFDINKCCKEDRQCTITSTLCMCLCMVDRF